MRGFAMTTYTHLQIPAGMSSMTSREQAMVVGGDLPLLGGALVYFFAVVCAAVGGAVWGAVTYALTH